MIRLEVLLKKKDQMTIDEEYARKLQAEEHEASRHSRVQQDEKANNSWDNIQAMMDADRLLAERLQARAREKFSKVQKARLYKQSNLKRISFDEIKELFDGEMRKVNDFVAMDSEAQKSSAKEAQESSTKRTTKHLESDISKKQKIDKNVEPVIDDTEELKKCMEIVLDDGDEVLIEATPIFSRSPTIIDYKIHKEGKKNYFKIITADELLKKFIMESCDPVYPLMVEKSKLDEDTQRKVVDPTHYHGMVGTLMYLTSSRPYLYSEDSAIALTAFADADYVGCQDTRRSTSGSMQLLGDRLVSWSSKRQKSAAISSTEVKYIALPGCCAQVLWMRSQLSVYGLGFNKIPIYHFIKEQVENGVVELYFVRMEYQLVDIFTKALCQERIEFLIDKQGIRSFTPETLKELADEAEE
uniref:Retrovirus-related Pol polyprotein from transposon TNT 1-94 n=1 Tax=Tanacetum cinerariifolium TaxID=118510 RepID=A0A699GWI2_TANCI|nr:hypothetical protein [Tanacetum cinerariifolium]